MLKKFAPETGASQKPRGLLLFRERHRIQLLRFGKTDHLDHIGRVDATKRAVAITRGHHFAFGIENELGRLNDLAPLFPKRPEHVGLGARDAVAHCEAEFIGHRFGLVLRVNTGRQYFDAECGELVFQFGEAGQLPAAVRSPMPAIKQHHAVFGVEAIRQFHRAAADQRDGHGGKHGTDMQLVGHGGLPLS